MLKELLNDMEKEVAKKVLDNASPSDVFLAAAQVANGLTDIKFPKKKVRKEKELRERIIVVCTTSWSNKKRIRAMLKAIGPKNIEYMVVGTSRGEQIAASVALELKIMLYRTHPWISSANDYIVQGKAMKLFKPTQVIAFNEDPEKNTYTLGYERLCKRSGTLFKMVTK